MLNLNELTNYELIDVSSYKTNLVNNIVRAYLVKYGKLIFFDFAGLISGQGTLFTNLPYKPIFNTELNFASNDRISTRAILSTDRSISIAYIKNPVDVYINGVYFTDE